jgi:hypothetical protein
MRRRFYPRGSDLAVGRAAPSRLLPTNRILQTRGSAGSQLECGAGLGMRQGRPQTAKGGAASKPMRRGASDSPMAPCGTSSGTWRMYLSVCRCSGAAFQVEAVLWRFERVWRVSSSGGVTRRTSSCSADKGRADGVRLTSPSAGDPGGTTPPLTLGARRLLYLGPFFGEDVASAVCGGAHAASVASGGSVAEAHRMPAN